MRVVQTLLESVALLPSAIFEYMDYEIMKSRFCVC